MPIPQKKRILLKLVLKIYSEVKPKQKRKNNYITLKIWRVKKQWFDKIIIEKRPQKLIMLTNNTGKGLLNCD